MEYEIEAEKVLFDDSTNPSLKQRRRRPEPPPPPAPAPTTKHRKAVAIPDEEPVA